MAKKTPGIKNLREIRRIAGLTQEQLAKVISVAYGTAQGIENGNKLYSADLVQRIAQRLGCGFEKNSGDGLPGLTKTRIYTGDYRSQGIGIEYTHDWFVEWNEMVLRKQMYSRMLERHRRYLDEMLEVACSLDCKNRSGSEGDASFALSDELMRKIVEGSSALVDDPRFQGELALREANLGQLAYSSLGEIQGDIEESHKRYSKLKEKIGPLKSRD